jgi:tetratricopeptide (TPR) repeat protein
VRFNRGVLYYELGRFRDAYLEFREALRIEPSSVEAKINLELAFEKLAAADNRSLTRRPGSASGEAGADAAQVFEFIRRTGGQQWIPNETVPADNDVDDW